MLCNALVLCDSEVLARQIGVTGRAVARAVKGPGSGGEGGMRARAAAKDASASAWRSRVMLRLSDSLGARRVVWRKSARTLGGDVTFLGGPVNNLGGLGE